MSVSVITTIKNEQNNIREFLDSLLTQSRSPDEIIITDGGSIDQTCVIIKSEYIPKHPHIKLIEEKCNIAKGRNLAIRASAHPIIAVTDAGCRMDKDWLKHLVSPLESNSSVDVVGGITIPDTKSKFEKIIGGFVAVTPDEMRSKPILISSRNITFRKSIWEKVGGYPEWLYLSGEDTLFNTELQKSHANIQIIPEAIVHWHPVSNFKKLFTQSFTYARGNGQAGLYKSLILKTVTMYVIFLALLIAGLYQPLCWTFFGLLFISYFTYSGYKLCRRLNDQSLFLMTIAIKFVIDLTNLSGYPTGLFLRLNSKRPMDQYILLLILFISFLPSLSLSWSIVDDGVSVLAGKQHLAAFKQGHFLKPYFHSDTYGRFLPLYWLYFVPQYFLFGTSVLFYRLVKIISLVILVKCIYDTAHLVTGNKSSGFLSGFFFLLFSPLLCNQGNYDTVWSNWYRLGTSESQQIIYLLLLTYFWWSYLLKPDKRNGWKILLCVLLLFLSFFTKETTFFLIPLTGLMFFLSYLFRSKSETKLWGYAFAVVVLFGILHQVLARLTGTPPIHRGEYTSAYHFDFPMIQSNIKPLLYLILEGFHGLILITTISFFYFIWKSRKFNKTISDTHWLQIFAFLWLLLGIGIFLPWQFPLGRYLLLVIPLASIFIGIGLSELYSLKASRFIKILQHAVIPSLIVFYIFNYTISMNDYIQYYRTWMMNNTNVINHLGSNVPKTSIVYVNLPQKHEFTFEMDLHIKLFKNNNGPRVVDLLLENGNGLMNGDYILCYPVYMAYSMDSVQQSVLDHHLDLHSVTNIKKETSAWRYDSLKTFLYNFIHLRLPKPLFYKSIHSEEWVLYQVKTLS